MKKTPINKLLDWIDLQRQNELTVLNDVKSYHPNDVRQARIINESCNTIITKATELLAEEREAIEEAYMKGDKAEFFRHCQGLPPEDNAILASNYFTKTYGGGDE